MKLQLRLLFLSAVIACGLFFSFRDAFVADEKEKPSHTLYLFRHAKSAHDNPALPDIQRPLAVKGEKEAEEMGKYFVEKSVHPDLIIASPSVRTRQTLAIVCRITGYDTTKIVWDSTVYAASFDALLESIRKHGGEHKKVLVHGHNPSITSVSNMLQSDKEFAEVLTAGLVAIDFNMAAWSEVGTKKGKLAFYYFPD